MRHIVFFGGMLLIFIAGGCVDKNNDYLVNVTNFSDRPQYARNNLLEKIAILTVEQAIDIAVARNPSFAAIRESLVAAQMRYYQAWGAYSPVVSAAGVIGSQIRQNVGSPDSSTFFTADVSVSLLVFDGLIREMNVLIAAGNRRKTEYDVENAMRLLRQSVVYAYNNILLTDEAEKIAANNFDFQQQMLTESTAKYKSGLKPKSDVLNFTALADQARCHMISAKFHSRLARFALAVLLGCDDGNLPPALRFPPLSDCVDELNIMSIDIYLDSALTARSDLNSFRESLRINEYELYKAYSAFSPVIYAFTSYSYSKNTITSNTTPGADFGDYSNGNYFNYGAYATWTLFNGFIRYNQLREKRSLLQSAVLRGAALWQEVIRDVRGSHAVLRQNAELIVVKKRICSTLLEQRDTVSREYAAGIADITRLNEAQKDYHNSALSLASSLSDLAKAVAALESASMIKGIFNPPPAANQKGIKL